MTSSLASGLEDANSTFRKASEGSRKSVAVALSLDLRVEEAALATLAVVALVETAGVVVVISTSRGSSSSSSKEESFSLFVFNKVGFCL